jgi:hypothetical protein
MKNLNFPAVRLVPACLLILSAFVFAGYKARPWSLRPASAYPAQLTSEGVTITVEPLYRNEKIAEVFDSKDMVSRGIMPIALGIFNENAYPVRVEAASIELIEGDRHAHTLPPGEVVYRLFHQGGKREWIPQPFPRDTNRIQLNRDALDDFDKKFLGSKVVGPHSKGGGFIYVHPPSSEDIEKALLSARVYIPEVFREDTGKKMIFFEIDTKPSVEAPSSR